MTRLTANQFKQALSPAILRKASLFSASVFAFFLLFVCQAMAGPPVHRPTPALDLSGFDHACGVAVDSDGDIYVSSAGSGQIKVYSPEHNELNSIANANQPCGLAVDGKGNLYASEKGTGDVVRYHPIAYPFVGPPSYGAPTTVDGSGKAAGIAVDPVDNRLYVAEETQIAVYTEDESFEAFLGAGDLSEATGVAVWTYLYSKSGERRGTRNLYVADRSGDTVKVFSKNIGQGINGNMDPLPDPKFRRTIDGPPGQSFGFGSAGAYLAVDPGNANAEEKCTDVAEQACTAGHLYVDDDAHTAVDEFDPAGEFVDQFSASPALADAEPTAIAIDRSGGAADGTVYVSTGAGAGAEVRAFGPLVTPGRAPLGQQPVVEPPSQIMPRARAAATDSYGNVYVAGTKEVRIFSPAGSEVTKFTDEEFPVDVAVDSKGNVYVIDVGPCCGHEIATYYAPSSFPPTASTTYVRHEPVATTAGWPAGATAPKVIAVNPNNDHVYIMTAFWGRELGSAVEGSPVIDSEFSNSIGEMGVISGVSVCGKSGEVYVAANTAAGQISVLDATGKELLARFKGSGSPRGLLPSNPRIAVDQLNCHVLAFEPNGETVREYDARGGFVGEYGQFTTGGGGTGITVDSACAIHRDGSGKLAPLDATTTPTCEQYDPGNGRAYVAYDETPPNTPDLWAFGPLAYGEPPAVVTGGATGVGGGSVTLNGSVDPRGFQPEGCRFDIILASDYQQNLESEDPAFEGAESVACAETPAQIGGGTEPVPVHADLSGLDPEGRYRYRLVASNKYGEEEGEAKLFGPPLLETKLPTPLYDEAIVRAEVEPSGLATSYHFEYGSPGGSAGEYGFSTPTKQLEPGEALVPVEAILAGLEEGATYHFRVVAENEAMQVAGPDQSFTTLVRRGPENCANAEYRTGLSSRLPDCRAYELVTPARTGGLSPISGYGGSRWNSPPTVPSGGSAGDRLSFVTLGTIEGFEGNGVQDGYRAARGPGAHPAEGWTTVSLGPSFSQARGGGTGQGFAPDQIYSWWEIESRESPFADSLPPGLSVRGPDGAVAGSPCNLVPSQSDFESAGCGELGTDVGANLRYLSAAGAHVIFSSDAHLEAEAAPEGTNAIYDRPFGSSSANVVSLKPDGTSFGAGEGAGYVASSEDGSAVVFTVGTVLYERRGGETLQVAEGATFAGIAEDGAKVAYVKGEKIFVFDAQTEGTTEIGEGTPINFSPDASHVFFSSEAVLPGSEENANGESPVSGKHNLYAWNGASTAFVAVLDDRDFEPGSFQELTDIGLQYWLNAVNEGTGGLRTRSLTRSTNGGVLVFQSHARLTGYDNENVGEVYRYDPAAPAALRLLCVSCDPTGAAPTDEATLKDMRPISPVRLRGSLIPNVTADGSEVFFQTYDPLLPEDANAAQDVYAWRAQGTGTPVCEQAGGCLALISSGQGETDNYLFAMSDDGHDVFFWTEDKLVGLDVTGSKSVYDARVDGGIPDPVPPAPCQGDACQPQGAEPPALPSPTTTGGGEEAPRRPHCPKGKHRVKGRCVRTHRHHHHHHHHRAHNHRRASR